MENFEIRKPSKEEQEVAFKSYKTLANTLEDLHTKEPIIEIEETEERIKIPVEALRLFAKILKAMGEGQPVSLVPIATEMTTQAAAEILGCSRPHLIKLLEGGEIPFTKIGKHRRVKYDDVLNYKRKMKREQKELIVKIIRADEDSGLYDS